MSKEEAAPGLLSKVVKFVRNPATSWSDLDNKETDRDEALSKQLLKEMIERKRRNDFVRKREFDMLRKIRKREATVGQDPAARPSFFQSSMPSKPDDRANTLKKIDEIEAQMSMQWWKTKHGHPSVDSMDTSTFPSSRSSVATTPPDNVPFLDNALPDGYAGTEPARLQGLSEPAARGAPSAAPLPAGVRPIAAAPVQPSPVIHRPMVANTQAPVASIGGLSGAGGHYDNASSGFSLTNMLAVEVAEVAHDAELEEASIRFANGDDAGAEAGLLDILGPSGSRVGHAETWMTLFDFYRATNQQDKFENAAIRFVQRFDRSAPQWFSVPDMVRQLAAPVSSQPHGNGQVADWICPSVVGIQTIAALKAALAKAPMPWRLDWTHLKTIEIAAVEPLCNVFNTWSSQPVQLRFIREPQLQQVLQKATPSNQRETPQLWWQLRMAALRLTHRPDEFELAALDFCVTYEVSPPAWESARCDYKSLDPEGGAPNTYIGDVYRDSVHSGLSVLDGDTHMDAMSSQMGHLFSLELAGQIQGDADAVLDQLESKLLGADVMVICCAKLIRVDFSAAGTLLNWVSARQAENRTVQFTEVNRLVSAFFNVIGITEHAQIFTRTD